MKKLFSVLILLGLSSCSPSQSIQVYFTPPGQPVEDIVVSQIEMAHSQILVEAYGFTSDKIDAALKSARRNRGVEVNVIFDKSNEGSDRSKLQGMVNGHRINVYIDDEPGIAHNKVMIIDSLITITGSFNWTEHAKVNEENLLVIADHDIAMKYLENWNRRRANSRKPE
jgi:phospholipase D